MKYLFALMVFALAFPVQVLAANSAVPRQTVGRVLLQVEQHGEAWYVDPVTETRYYLRNGTTAYNALRTFGLGITTSDLHGIPLGYDERLDVGVDSDNDGLTDRFENAIGTFAGDSDSDDDGHMDGTEVKSGNNPLGSKKLTKNSSLVNRMSGRILLQVEDRGEAWYVNPADGKRYYMTDGPAAYSIMRFLSLGITDADLAPIPVYAPTPVPMPSPLVCESLDMDCFLGQVFAGQEAFMSVNDVYEDDWDIITINGELALYQDGNDFLLYVDDFVLNVEQKSGEAFDYYEELGIYEEDFPLNIACSIPESSLYDFRDSYEEIKASGYYDLDEGVTLGLMAHMIMLDTDVDCDTQ